MHKLLCIRELPSSIFKDPFLLGTPHNRPVSMPIPTDFAAFRAPLFPAHPAGASGFQRDPPAISAVAFEDCKGLP
jgi:hypothetical protein